MARKQTRRSKDVRGGALGDFAEQVGTLLGQAEARWRTWQGSETRDAIVETVKDVRDRASTLLKDMGVELPFGTAPDAAATRAPRKPRKAAGAAGSARKTPSRPGPPRKSRKAAKAPVTKGSGARARR